MTHIKYFACKLHANRLHKIDSMWRLLVSVSTARFLRPKIPPEFFMADKDDTSLHRPGWPDWAIVFFLAEFWKLQK
jgi:hypothetical protein